MSESWEPHKFQLRAMSLMLSQSSLGLLLDPGMGKTATWLGAFTTLKQLGYVDKMLVIAPLKPMYGTWPVEIDKYAEFEHLTWCFLHGPSKDWHYDNTDADIYLVNPEGIQWLAAKGDISKLADVICVDESTKFKASGSKRFKAMRSVFPKFNRRWIGSGTPSPNGLEDLFAQIYILDGGNALGKYVTHFRDRWFYTEPWNPYKHLPLPNALDEITTAIAPLVLQLSAEDYIDLPELAVVDKFITLPKEARRMYDELEKEFITTFPDSQDILTAPSVASAGGRCRQICNGAVYTETNVRTKVHEYTEIHSEKLDLMDEILEEIGEHPTLIIYEFQHDLRRISSRHLDWPCLTGMTGECLQNMIAKFNEGKIPRLLIQSSAAHGLNIQGNCNHMIWFGITWNWEDYKQMVDRLYRQGQCAKMVLVYRLLAERTLDIEVAARLRIKMEEEHNVKTEVSRKREEAEALLQV